MRVQSTPYRKLSGNTRVKQDDLAKRAHTIRVMGLAPMLAPLCSRSRLPAHRTISGKSRWIRGGLVALVLASVPAIAGCERAPSADGLKEWTPTDHDRAEEMGRPANGQQPQAEARGDGGGGNPNALIEVAWSQNCALCHGVVGRGDGPNGPMVKASDLTRESWQATVKDDEIAAVIKNGKGRMPKFEQLPDSTVRGLVGRIRAVRGK